MESVAIQMQNLLDEVNESVKESVERESKSMAREAVNKLKAASPVQNGGTRSGRYARGWGVKNLGDGVVVYNRTDWQLTHLLENGHAVVNRYGDTGARAGAIKHIEPVEQWAIQEFPIRVLRGIK